MYQVYGLDHRPFHLTQHVIDWKKEKRNVICLMRDNISPPQYWKSTDPLRWAVVTQSGAASPNVKSGFW